jgi:2-keto-4-pentenoate hydratase/2-oxohepta-3-ene-1,7-dioic acid hydratase in catechol pathway
MRLATIQTAKGPRACVELAGNLVDVNAVDPNVPATVKGILALGDAGLSAAKAAAERGASTPGAITATADAKWLAPVPNPSKIVCLGLNYKDHAIESGVEPPSEPVLFSKYPTTLTGHLNQIVLPPVSQEVDYEAELVIVVGKGGKNIARASAMEHVAGYTVGHDVSARDWQLNKPGKQWMAGKTFDTFAPMGPALVTRDEVPDPQALRIRLRLNGETMQDSSTSQLIFPVDYVIAYLSQIFTLEPGDLIFTGTPPGVGMARKPPVWLKNGDVVEVEIERLGVLRNTVAG